MATATGRDAMPSLSRAGEGGTCCAGWLTVLVAAALLLATPGAVSAQASGGASSGTAAIDTGNLPNFVPGDATGALPEMVRPRYRHYRRRLVVPRRTGTHYVIAERQDTLPPEPDSEPEPQRVPDDPASPETQAQPVADPPPPGSPRTVVLARGAHSDAAEPEPGLTLPRDRPVVLLDWRVHALSEPPPGAYYVRYGRSVVLIEGGSRQVLSVVYGTATADPGAAQ